MKNDTIIKIEGLRRDFTVSAETVRALKGVSFQVHAGEFITIMGASGSGKTTLLNILGCLDRPTGGDYVLDGASIKNMDQDERARLRNQKIGFVFQSYNLLPRASALENVELPLLYNSSLRPNERRERAAAALDRVGLLFRIDHTPSQLSGGQQQRVAIARALVNDPVIILSDEATGNLDTRTSYEIMAVFQELNRQGATIVFITHEPDIAAFSGRTITLRDGKILADTLVAVPARADEILARLPVEENEEARQS